ncbi:beta-1,6-N-acetylglucosaminyltransferase [Paenibacillus protaetiae]|uniref:Peptide O-xylosyltransferase n=1 Tax=Paenibacillus protaetiae TaxID=2509456 RepID=A0A4V0YFI2_9BACL|nr:beta-1,6-N-acetylglucosaminyltransferase [Paenibacillus protaetiae]QAY67801.1 hypothetical protein ET464_16795 [Paenibacillus protaetiae]
MKLAYLILAHHKMELLDRLMHAIYSPDHSYMIHVDAKADADLHRYADELAAANPNIKILPSRSATWACWSLVQVELDGIKELLHEQWDFYILLSGQDFPAASQEAICRTLAPYPGKNFMRIGTMPPEEEELRLNHYYVEDCGEMKTMGPRNSFGSYFVEGFKPYMGSQWKILHRSFCEFAVSSPLSFDMQDYFRYALVPDELFFHTLLMNSTYKDSLINNHLRYYEMDEFHTSFRRAKTLAMEQIKDIDFHNPARPVLFVRKVDDEREPEVISFLEKRLAPGADAVQP